jgi:hypothetical protein
VGYKKVLTKFKELLPLCKQTYYFPFLWAFTWYSFWIFRDITLWHQINTLNIGAAIISACGVASAVPIRNAFHKALNLVPSQIKINVLWALTSLWLQTNRIIQMIPQSFAPRNQNHHFVQIESHPQQTIRLNTQKSPFDPKQRELTSKMPPSDTNGCPKNLDYYTQKPRPKQAPEECIACKKLIPCVCLTSN